MADPPPKRDVSEASGAPGQYVVVARRYRPQTFEELVGQEHIAQALANAISTNRVGHAYLFTGVRGVGKTSAARILAKALNCVDGPVPVPCNRCDICESISGGDDIDVAEIDGASNRGIDEIRQLRQNVSVRPSRSRHKIYIIDEVHMLTREAFNALLKTLEEPPEHVKFIFCTTEPTKIPITILSRCQRFDFAGILAKSIAERLRQIVELEGVEAQREALEVIARRAAGSMRDGQSLLEQLLAFAPGRIAVADVHEMLGSAGDERLAALVGHLVDRNPAGALADLDAALGEGVDVAQLIEQLFGYLRDCMAAASGCSAESFFYAPPGQEDEVIQTGQRLGLETILAGMQILDHTLGRLRFSSQGRILAEVALVRICGLEDLDELPSLITQLQGVAGGPSGPQDAAAPTKPKRPTPKKAELPPPEPTKEKKSPADERTAQPGGQGVDLTPENAEQIWNQVLATLTSLAARHAKDYDHVATPAPNHLVISFKPAYTLAKSFCERPDQAAKFEQTLADLVGKPVKVQFALLEDDSDPTPEAAGERDVSPHQQLERIAQHPMIRRAEELFGAHPTRVDPPDP
ncbi:MAG: DNA polymerase III subunit gamma/tau [Planctomycetota bacterium]|jgi:DNA polymerase-3 subunit gamma/tau